MFLAFGEIMMRVCPPGMLRLRQALPGPMECTFGGGEANVTRVAITLRESISASHNNWGAMLLDARANKTFFAPLDEIVALAGGLASGRVQR